jgi:hypothetical protein
MMETSNQKQNLESVVPLGFVVFFNPHEAGAANAETVHKESLAFLKAASFSVVPVPVMVHDLPSARQAGAFLKEARVSIIIIHLATWTGDDLLVEMLSWFSKDPFIINWALRDMNSGSLCGCQQFNMVQRKLEYCSDFVLGREAASQEKMTRIINRWKPNAKYVASDIRFSENETENAVCEALRHLRVGIFGSRTQGMMEVAFDEFGINDMLGPSIHAIPVAEIKDRAVNVSLENVNHAVTSFREKFASIEITASSEAIEESIRIYVAMKQIIEEKCLDTITIDCYPAFMGKACLGFSMLADEGIACACEGDVHSAILAWLVQRLSGQPTNHIDTLDVDSERNTLTGGHCGSCSLQLARPGSAVIAPVRLANEGVCVMFPVKEGPVTIVNLTGRDSYYQASILTGTSIEAGLVFPGNPVTIKLDAPVDKFLDMVAQHGLGHHALCIDHG